MDQSKSLRMEPLGEHHAMVMLPVLQDERIYAYIPEARYDTVAALEARYRRLANGSGDPRERWLNWILFHRQSDVAVGFLQSTVYPREHVADVAYVVSPSYWRRGIATEALGWLMKHLDEAHDVDLARAQIDVRNAASIALVSRLGFMHVRTVVEDGCEDAIFHRRLKNPATRGRGQMTGSDLAFEVQTQDLTPSPTRANS